MDINNYRAMPAHSKSVCFLLYCLLTIWQPAVAAIYSCKTANGVQFQDNPCSMATAPEAKPKPKSRTSKLPAGIHKSWFEKPPSTRYTAWCDTNGCECGPFVKAFDAGTTLAVADAMYLDGAWHRYDGYQQQLIAEKHDAGKKIAITAAIDEAVCDILMSQAILKKFSKKTIKELKALKLEAEARGFDTPDACESDDFVACDYFSKTELYDRMRQDIKALSYQRDSFTALLE